jgi:hypothetical protein
MRYANIKVRMTGNSYFPAVTINRDGDHGHFAIYRLNFSDLKRIQELFSSHQGHIYVDLANSEVELLKVKP